MVVNCYEYNLIWRTGLPVRAPIGFNGVLADPRRHEDTKSTAAEDGNTIQYNTIHGTDPMHRPRVWQIFPKSKSGSELYVMTTFGNNL